MYSGEQVDSLTLQQALQSVIFSSRDVAQTQPCWLYQPASLVPYLPAWHWQQHWQKKLQQQPQHPDLLLLLQHPPVYTLGQGSRLEFLGFDLANPPAPIHQIERGGEVTYHCPGQLVGYPILNLHRYKTDLHWYLRQLEEVIIHLLASYQLQGERIAGLTGVWVDGQKVAAIGIKVSRWITMHGFALNVCPDLLGFQAIVPCGIADRPVGSLAGFLPNLRLEEVQAQLCASFAAVFGLEFIQQTWQELPED